MKTIHKHQFSINHLTLHTGFQITTYANMRVLDVQVQNGLPTMWVLVDPYASQTIYKFRIYGTGHDVENKIGNYIATIQLGEYVWHIFAA
jgi:hypothetical protein